ncbi:MAG TPA: hypothetical protein VK866_13255, partial [Acidimicrobiales bacterium]|nr:hypothetical protein [Acidimicrobiales bacterium]
MIGSQADAHLRPVLELVMDPTGPDLGDLVRALAAHVRPTAPDPAVVPAARLVSSPTAADAPLAAADAARPMAVVVTHAAQLDHPVTTAARVVIVRGDDALVEQAGPAAVALPEHPVDLAAVVPVPPFVRARWRARHGFAADLVAVIGRPDAPTLDAAARATALRVAAAVDVSGPAIL